MGVVIVMPLMWARIVSGKPSWFNLKSKTLLTAKVFSEGSVRIKKKRKEKKNKLNEPSFKFNSWVYQNPEHEGRRIPLIQPLVHQLKIY